MSQKQETDSQVHIQRSVRNGTNNTSHQGSVSAELKSAVADESMRIRCAASRKCALGMLGAVVRLNLW